MQALLVTFIWSTSWVLIKFGLVDVPALTFAGLRYGLAFACLVPFMFRSGRWAVLRTLTRLDWLRLVGLGLLLYTVAQGAQFVGLAYLPAMTVSLVLNFTTLVVAFGGILFLSEYPSRLQWLGVILFMLGIAAYFYPVNIPQGQWFGLAVVLLGVFANAISSVLGRSINRETQIPPLTVTVVSMGIDELSHGLAHISG